MVASGKQCWPPYLPAYAERNLETVASAKKLARYTINKRKRSLRDIAAELEPTGHVAAGGMRYGAAAIGRMIAA